MLVDPLPSVWTASVWGRPITLLIMFRIIIAGPSEELFDFDLLFAAEVVSAFVSLLVSL